MIWSGSESLLGIFKGSMSKNRNIEGFGFFVLCIIQFMNIFTLSGGSMLLLSKIMF